MAAFHILLRSQSSLLLNSPKFNLILHSLNPNFSRHFHSDDSITPKSSPESPAIDIDSVSEHNSSPEEPISEPSPRVCSVKPVSSDGNPGLDNRVTLWSDVAKRRFPFSKSENEADKCNGSVNKSEVSDNVMNKSWLPDQKDVNLGFNPFQRIRLSGLFGSEVNAMLGGGIVPGSLILVGGDPGVGKSTLALQMAANIAENCDVGGAGPVFYVCGEENIEQIGNRANRLSIKTKDLLLYSNSDVKVILDKMQLHSPRAVVVDSIQTMHLKGVTGSRGGSVQLKACTAVLRSFAKKTNTPVILIVHVIKSGDIAGPRTLEHMVDTVLYMECPVIISPADDKLLNALGEKHSSHRFLRSVKNRFGSTDELRVFKMSDSGLEAVLNPSEIFSSEEHSVSEHLIGHAIAVIFHRSRTFLVQVQALCVLEFGATSDVHGVQLHRARMILSVLKKRVGLKLKNHSIYLNTITGVSLRETSGDLAMAAAICSSFLEFPLPNNMAFIGEIGLGGELRKVPKIEKRVNMLAKLGYKTCVVPVSAVKALEGLNSEIQIVGCKNLKQVIDQVFKKLD